MKNRLSIISMVMALLAFFLVTSSHQASADEKKYIIATDTTYAPFEYEDNGEYVGIDMDLIRAIAEDQGFEIEIRPLGFNAAVQALEAKQVDGVIAGMSITDERKQSFDFSDPYYSAGTTFAVKKDSGIKSYDDLNGKTVAVKTGTTGADFVNSIKDEYNLKITTFEDSANMYEDVLAGNSDAAFEDTPVMAYAIKSQGLELEIPTDTEEAKSDLGFAVSKGENAELLQMFNDGLANLQASGEFEEILNKYIGEDATVEKADNSFFGLIKANWQQLLNGLGRTLLITLVSIIFSLIIGMLIGLMSISRNTILNGIAVVYTGIFRGLPMIVLAFFVYFGIPSMFGIKLGSTAAGIISLSLNAGAFMGEIFRGGVNAVPVGQMEAARSLGLPYRPAMSKIILPQAIRIMVPSFINQFVTTLKDTSILSVIGLVELTQTGKIIIARTYASGNMWMIIGIMYIIVITILTFISNRLERRLK
ncbi:amino acid ABC transporter substrate-binding protein/permease [Bavariicoccus seileri]|uniref:amino acid ABC transporter substrate-binding protein/permease n=1 Tax=Bavariicoccus seileri TaxID=549685 RepID=UPI003F8EA7F2